MAVVPSGLLSGDPAGSVTTVTVTMPTASAGDLIEVAIEINGGSGTTITPPGAFTSKQRISNDTTGVISMELFERIATGSEAATYDFTLSAASANTSWQSWIVTGMDTSSWWSPATLTTNSGNNSTLELTATGFTAGADNSIAFAFFGAGTSTYTPSTPTGYSVLGAGHTGRGWGIFYKSVSAGSVADALSSLGTTNRYWVSMAGAIQPPAAGQLPARRWMNIPNAGARIQRGGL